MLLNACKKDIPIWRCSWLTARSHASAADAIMAQTQPAVPLADVL